jgi:hypothetical protein
MINIVMLFLFLIVVKEICGENCAIGKTAYTSSVEGNKVEHNVEKAVDGDHNTRWASEGAGTEWVIVDLGELYFVDGVTLRWEVAFGKVYTIDVSSDNTSWSSVYSTSSGDGKNDSISFSGVTARYVRMRATERGSVHKYSLYEFEINCGSFFVSDLNSPGNSSTCGSIGKPCRTVGYTYNTRRKNGENIIIYKLLTDTEGATTDVTLSGNIIGKGGYSSSECAFFFFFFTFFCFD